MKWWICIKGGNLLYVLTERKICWQREPGVCFCPFSVSILSLVSAMFIFTPQEPAWLLSHHTIPLRVKRMIGERRTCAPCLLSWQPGWFWGRSQNAEIVAVMVTVSARLLLFILLCVKQRSCREEVFDATKLTRLREKNGRGSAKWCFLHLVSGPKAIQNKQRQRDSEEGDEELINI